MLWWVILGLRNHAEQRNLTLGGSEETTEKGNINGNLLVNGRCLDEETCGETKAAEVAFLAELSVQTLWCRQHGAFSVMKILKNHVYLPQVRVAFPPRALTNLRMFRGVKMLAPYCTYSFIRCLN